MLKQETLQHLRKPREDRNNREALNKAHEMLLKPQCSRLSRESPIKGSTIERGVLEAGVHLLREEEEGKSLKDLT